MFPGQGSQSTGMGRLLLAEFPQAREILEEASQRCGFDLEYIRAKGPASELARPEVAEPLLAATQMGYASVLMQAGISPDVIAGYSAGEVAAYYSAGVLSQGDALEAAVIRGRVLSQFTSSETRMIAVAGLPWSTLLRVVNQELESIEIAGRNAPDHYTLVGTHISITACATQLRSLGGTISDIHVSGPWHSRSLQMAASEIESQFASLQFSTPKIELFSSRSGKPEVDPLRLFEHLAQQVSQTIQWENIVTQWQSLGVQQYTEVGAGRVLMGILRRNLTNYDEYRVECVESASGSIAVLKRLLENPTLGINK